MAKDFQTEDVYKIIDRFEASTLSELEIEQGDFRVRMKRETAGAVGIAAPVVNIPAQVDAPTAAPVATPAAGNVITAPVVGSFYRAPSPDADPFVQVGDKVKKGDVVAIIEAMKVMNEVSASCDGTIVSIDVEDGSLVEYEQVLMRIDTANV